jgi:hypothetical protein
VQSVQAELHPQQATHRDPVAGAPALELGPFAVRSYRLGGVAGV